MALGIKKLVNQIPEESCHPGDVYITNDPWALAGHLNDVCVFSPIFHKGKLTAFTACVFHHSDIGGRVSSDNHDVYEDGLFIPLVKLYDADRINESVVEMIKWNVRTPDEVIGDIRSQIAANHVCAEKISQMLDEYQLEGLDDLADEIIHRTEKSMREAISNVPDGVYRAEGIIEQGKGKGDIVIKAAVHVEGSDIMVDLEGSSPQVDWGGNVVFNFTYAYVFMAMKSMFDPDIPNNDGCTAPIAMKAPLGSVVNCKFPGGCGGPHADRAFRDGDHIPRHGGCAAGPGDCGQRRNARQHERALRQARRRPALAFGADPRRRHGCQRPGRR
jgi:N-methylhydantoinase B